jgi:outer membrane protein
VKRVLTALLIASCATPALSTTLQEALVEAYKTNPTLTGARATQRANDENTAIQRARGLPTVNATSTYTEYVVIPGGAFSNPQRQVFVGVTGSVPVYQGGAVSNGIKAADARIDAVRDQLRDTEASLFATVVAAYMDVVRDEAILSLNRKQLDVLTVNLRASRDRFQVGDLTRTDVAQSEARLALQRGQLEQAQANLIASRENYIRIVGSPPVDLQPPPPLPGLPGDPQTAVATALDSNPALRAAQRSRDAARYDVGVARSTRLPRVTINGQNGYNNYLGSIQSGVPGVSLPQTNDAAQVGATLSIPLFQGGGPAAQIRQAQQREGAAIENITLTERSVISQTRSAFAAYEASNALIVSSQAAVDANTLSLEGVRAENSVGNRTILDILNAEQELLNSQVNLVSARRNSYVAGFSLLAAMGHAEARDLGLDAGTLYDPVVNYKRAKRSIFDWDSEKSQVPVATRTVNTPAQTAIITGEPVIAPLKTGKPDPTQTTADPTAK